MDAIKYLLLLSACILIACTPPKVPSEVAELPGNPLKMNEHQIKKATSVITWEITGALAARSKKKGWAAQINWLQQGLNHYQIRLFGPLGGGTILIEKNGAMVTYADGPKKIASRSADELLEHQTGIRLPVKNLYYWVRGLPAPGRVTSSHYDSIHQLTSMTQAGYTINYSNYTSVDNTVLPGKIQLQGHGVVIKLVIKHWTI